MEAGGLWTELDYRLGVHIHAHLAPCGGMKTTSNGTEKTLRAGREFCCLNFSVFRGKRRGVSQRPYLYSHSGPVPDWSDGLPQAGGARGKLLGMDMP